MYKNIFLFIDITKMYTSTFYSNHKFVASIYKKATSLYHLVIVISSVSKYGLAYFHLP